MSDTNWTPGPWEVMQLGQNHYCILWDGNTVVPYVYGADHSAARANAHLIAAAPELYEAVESLLALCNERQTTAVSPRELDIVEAASAALAKAKGETE